MNKDLLYLSLREYFETKISAESYQQLEKDKGAGLEKLYKQLIEKIMEAQLDIPREGGRASISRRQK